MKVKQESAAKAVGFVSDVDTVQESQALDQAIQHMTLKYSRIFITNEEKAKQQKFVANSLPRIASGKTLDVPTSFSEDDVQGYDTKEVQELRESNAKLSVIAES